MDASCSSKYWDCVGSELQAEEDPNLRELSQQTYYGSAPEYLWSELAEPEEDPAAGLVQETHTYKHQSFRNILKVITMDPSDIAIVESIAQGGQAHVSLAKCPWAWATPGRLWAVKRYKGRLGVRAVHELRRRIALVRRNIADTRLSQLIGLSEDNITGEVSVVM